MNKKFFLIVEDLAEEQEKAKEIALMLNLKFLIANNLQKAKMIIEKMPDNIAGIVTDIHFPVGDDSVSRSQPNGLAVIAIAVKKNIPVSVCSDLSSHYAFFVRDVTSLLEEFPNYSPRAIPVTVGAKNWLEAFANLLKLIIKE